MKQLLIMGALMAACFTSQAITSPPPIVFDVSWRTDLPVDEWWWGDSDRRDHQSYENEFLYIDIWDDLWQIHSPGVDTKGSGISVGLRITFQDYPRRWAEDAIIEAGGGTYEIIEHGWVRFTWSAPEPDTNGVPIPDTGSTVALLGLALCGLFFTRKLHHEMT